MIVELHWSLEIPDSSIPELVDAAIGRGFDQNLSSRKELVGLLMQDGGLDVIETILQDPSQIKFTMIRIF
jgi:hypothetical protein